MTDRPTYHELEKRVRKLEGVKLKYLQTKSALTKSKQQYLSIIQNLPVLICSYVQGGDITFANKAYCDYFDKKPDELIGTNFLSFIPKEERGKVMKSISNLTPQSPVQIHEHRAHAPDGNIRWQQWTNRAVFDNQGKAFLFHAIGQDITERKQHTAALIASEKKYRALIETTNTGYLILDKAGRVIDANQEYARLSGHNFVKEILGRSVVEWTAPHDRKKNEQEVKKCCKKGGVKSLQIDYMDKTGRRLPVEINAKLVHSDDGVRILSLCRDITERSIKNKLQESQFRLIEYAADHSIKELLQKFLDEAEILTESKIGFFHFVENDQVTLSLQAWSTNTLEKICKAEGGGQHYPKSQAGVWADCLNVGGPIIHNDYESLQHKKGLPEGHAPVVRELVVPVIRGGKVMAILGVGNKPSDYHIHDVETLQQLADHAWETVVGKRAEEQTKRSERFLDTIVENIPNMLFVKDAEELRFIRFNKAGEELLGLSRDKLIGKNDYDFFPKNEADFFTRKDREVLASRQLVDIPDEPIQTKAKGERRLHTKKIPILDDCGDPEYLLGISEDITEYKKIEAQLRQTQKMESIGNLAGGVAHDFNNILCPIIGLSEMMLEDFPQDSMEYDNIQEIFTAGKRGSELVKQILAFSRRSAHKLIPVQIQQILKEVIKLSRSTIPSDIDIISDIQQDCGQVMADPVQIHQIAMNLITNAYHAVEKSGGQLSVTLRETELPEENQGNKSLIPGRYALFSVSDTGCGIAPEAMDKIFDPYFTTKKKNKGTGLGLAVVYGIIKECRGDIEVRSTLGTGTKFTVHIPIIETSHEQKAAEPEKQLKTGNERILLVDDEAPVARLEKQILQRLGYRVTARESSTDALNTFKAAPDAFDLVVTDMTMPNLTGDQLAREMISIRKDIPVIICTGFSERMNEKTAKHIGIKGFLMKPVAKLEMAQMVRTVLDEQKKQ
ncbi:MAG: PAS domain S-box protein [Desulfobacter sp.]|nr:MAG: PAS domain S-box protein [Desulfobacter sp.]